MLFCTKLHVFRKYFAFLLVVNTVTGTTYAQSITLAVKREPLSKVITLLEQQSDYRFIYSTEAMAKARPVTLNVNNEVMEDVLPKCFAGQPLQYKIDKKQIVIRLKDLPTPPPQAPIVRPLRGKVTNDKGEPMAGITISVRYSSLATVSDGNGDFSFADLPPNSILIVSGAETEEMEIGTNTQSFIAVVIRPRIGTLDETMVIAYGKTTRRYSTGTVSSIKEEEIARQPVSNLLNVLSGRVTGVQVTSASGVPGSNMTVRIRGRNSIANGNDPLYLLDGVPFPGTPLNGVFGGPTASFSSPLDNINPDDIESIEILKDAAATSIYGSRGANGVILITTKKGKVGKTGFGMKVYTGVGGVTRRVNMMKTADYLMMRREAFANDGTAPTLANSPDLLIWDTTRYTDWQKVLIGNTVNVTDVTSSLSGGTAQTQFMASVGYRKETTVYPGSFYAEKYSGTSNIRHSSADRKFSVNISTSCVLNNNFLPRQDLISYLTLAPNAPSIYTEDGKLNWEQSTWNNPLSETLKTFRINTENFNFNFSASYKLPFNFTVRLTSGYNSIQVKEHSVTPLKAQNPAQAQNAIALFGNRTVKTVLHEPQLLYNISRKNHDLEVLTGGSFQQTITQSLYQAGSGYASDDLLHSLRAAPTIITSGDDYIRYRYAAVFGRVNYSYLNRYLTSLSIRSDGSSRYGPSNRFSTFASAGVAWIFTKEPFIERLKTLSFGKLKLSAGITGNDQIGDYRYMDLYSTYSYPYQNISVYYPTQLFNPEFGWEQVQKLEAALDLGFLKDRLLVNVNYYYNTTTNQLVNYALPTLTGFSGIIRNIPATIRNTGFETEISADIIRTRKFSWNASFNITFPTNKLVDFKGIEASTYANSYAIGYPLSIAKRLHYTGINSSTGVYTFADVNNDGKLTVADDYKTIIDLSQQFFGGVQQTLDYGRLNAAILFQFARQPYAPSYESRFNLPGILGNQPTAILNRWQKAGDEAVYQRYSFAGAAPITAFNNYRVSDVIYSDASFIRLRNVCITYDLLKQKTRLRWVKNCKLMVQGQNLFTITNYQHFDPETQHALPLLWMVTGGLQVNF